MALALHRPRRQEELAVDRAGRPRRVKITGSGSTSALSGKSAGTVPGASSRAGTAGDLDHRPRRLARAGAQVGERLAVARPHRQPLDPLPLGQRDRLARPPRSTCQRWRRSMSSWFELKRIWRRSGRQVDRLDLELARREQRRRRRPRPGRSRGAASRRAPRGRRGGRPPPRGAGWRPPSPRRRSPDPARRARRVFACAGRGVGHHDRPGLRAQGSDGTASSSRRSGCAGRRAACRPATRRARRRRPRSGSSQRTVLAATS